MDPLVSGKGTVAAVVNTVIFSNYMKSWEYFNNLKDYHIFTQGYGQPR